MTNKASNMSVSLFIDFHNLRSPVIHKHLNYSILVFVKGVKIFGEHYRIYAVYSKTAMEVNRVDKYKISSFFFCLCICPTKLFEKSIDISFEFPVTVIYVTVESHNG